MLRKAFSLLAVLVIFLSLAGQSQANTNLSSYSVFATNSVWVRQNAVVNSGNIGVEDSSPGPWLDSQSEVTIGYDVFIADGISAYGDSVKIKSGGSGYDVYYNELDGNGTVRGSEYTPLALPLGVSLPDFPTPAPGTENHTIPIGGSLVLDPGFYGEITVKQNATLTLTGGTYHFENLDLGDAGGSQVLFQGPTDVIINNRLGPGKNAIIGPAAGSGISAKDIRIFVNGINGSTGNLGATPKAAQVGYNNTLQANIYAPNGTLLIKQGTVAEGAFIARDVQIGLSVQVTLNSGFGAYPEPTVSISAVPETIKVGESATLSWSSTDADSANIDRGVGDVPVTGSTPVSPAITTTYTITVTGPGGITSAQATVFVEDFFTFTQNVNELDNQTLTFTPDGSPNFYSACRDASSSFHTDPAGGTTLSLDDDDYEMVTLTGGAQVFLYGVSYSSFYVGSNGYITFTEEDTEYSDSFADHFDTPRLSGLFDDLKPPDGGTISWKQLADRAVVTFQDIPEYGSSNSNSFQIEMFFDGTIRLTYLGIDATDGTAGLSAGGGVPAGFVESDPSVYGTCLAPCEGDFDADGDVDEADQAIFDADFGRSDCAQGEPCEGDFDGDGNVDASDQAVFDADFGRTDCPTAVPYVVGMDQITAESIITSANLTVGTITTSSSNTAPAGEVISQSPSAGIFVAQGSPVTLEISSGPAPDDFFTFNQSVNELDNQSLTFTPDGSPNFYIACREAAAAFPTDPTGGTTLSLGDDDYEMVTLTGGAQVTLYGANYSSFYIGSNGYITFTESDTDYSESFGDHFDTPRISGLFDDLKPSASTTISWKQLADRVVVTYEAVPEISTSNSNSFQIEMLFDGKIRITYLGIDAGDGIAGLSAGAGIPDGFVESDMSAFGSCLLPLDGDFDVDGDVDEVDRAVFDADFGRTDCTQGEPCEGDFDGDGDVDEVDQAVFDANFGRTDGPRAIPDVVGLDQATAQSTIVSAGLTVGTITTDYSDTVPSNHVIDQSPSAGTIVASGSSVGLVVSLGLAPPTVSISATPDYIAAGDSATLSWTSVRAETATIDHGIGGVDVNESITVSPPVTTTYTITVTGPGGTATDSVTVNVITPPVVNITDPLDGVTVHSPFPFIRVSGTVDDSNATVTVNGISATVWNGIFTAENVPLAPGENAITANATNLGVSGTDTISLTYEVPPEDIDLGLDENEQQGGGGIVGETIRILNGNVVETREDLRYPSPNSMGLSFQAAYNSQSDVLGALGFGWYHTYEVTLDPSFQLEGETLIKINDETGRASYFLEEAPGEYLGALGTRTTVKSEGGSYVWYRLNGTRYSFSSTGVLNWIEDEKGNRLQLGYDAQGQLETVTDTATSRTLTFYYNIDGLLSHIDLVTPAGSYGTKVTFAYETSQNLTSVTYADGSGFTYAYSDPNDIHNLTEKMDKLNHLLRTWTYDGQDRALDTFSVQGRGVSNFVYASETQVDVTDAYGTVRSYILGEVNGRKRVIALQGIANATYTDSNAVRWDYDDSMNLTEVEYAGGTINQYQDYDESGNPGTVRLAVGTLEERVIYYTYHPQRSVVLTRTEASVLQEGGNKIAIWDYDDDYNSVPNENPTGLLSRIVAQGYTQDQSGAVVPYEYIATFSYNSKGQVVSVDGPLAGSDDTTTFSYDTTTGDLLSITWPLIGTTSFANYDAAGRVVRVTDVNSQSESFTYDANGRITSITHEADGGTRSVTYNSAGMTTAITDEDGVTRSFEYDPVYGRLTQITDHDGNYISYTYDAQGHRIEMSTYNLSGTRTNRKRWTYQHPDIPGKLWKEIRFDDSYAEYGYDDRGNVSAVTDNEGHTTTYGYDTMNRLTTITKPGNVVTGYTYDGHSNLASVTDANLNKTTYAYDDIGRLVSNSSPDSGTSTFDYNAAGDLVRKIDAKGIMVTYDYDFLNRLTAIHFPDSAQDITFTYDAGTHGKGRRTGMTDPSGSTAFGYDSRGRLVEKTMTVSGLSYPLTRTYTPGSRLSSITYPTNRSITYSRHSNGKIQGVSTAYNSTATTLVDNLAYKPFGKPTGMTTGSGGTVNNVSEECDCLTVINPGQPTERTFSYDHNGNLTSTLGTNTPWYNQDLTYDALNRLVSATGPYGTISYTYDKVGNRLTRTVNGQTETYFYITGTNKLEEIAGPNPTTFTYDTNGNILSIGNKTFVYNQNNRVIRVEESGNVVGEYTYNGLGQRVTKVAGGNTTIFHYDFDGNIIDENLPDGTFTTEYLYLGSNRLAKVDVSSGGSLYYYLNDYLGTPQIMTDETGTVVWEAMYKPYGDAEVDPSSSVVNNFRFQGQYYDSETVLHYNYYRYYDPGTGRYLEPDPAGLLGGGGNLYVYSLDNPVKFADPFGLWTVGLDLSTTTGALPAATGGYTFMITQEADVVILRHAGVGKVFPGEAGGAIQLQYTNAPSAEALEDESLSTGGSLTLPGSLIGPTGEWIVTPSGYQGVNFGVAAGLVPSPVKTHLMIEDSSIVWKRNLKEITKNWLREVLGLESESLHPSMSPTDAISSIDPGLKGVLGSTISGSYEYPQAWCGEIRITGEDTVDPGTDWIGTIEPASPSITCGLSSNSGFIIPCSVNEAGSEVAVYVDPNDCGSFTTTVTKPALRGCSEQSASRQVRINNTGQGGAWTYAQSIRNENCPGGCGPNVPNNYDIVDCPSIFENGQYYQCRAIRKCGKPASCSQQSITWGTTTYSPSHSCPSDCFIEDSAATIAAYEYIYRYVWECPGP